MIQAENLMKIYKTGDIEVVALQGLDLTVEDGELMAIIGNSGSGKSTLLNMLGGLDTPSAGSLTVDGKNLLKLTPKELMEYKRLTVGFMWQNSARNLIPYLTAQENIELPIQLAGLKVSELPPLPDGEGGEIVCKTAADRARALLSLVGLPHKAGSRLGELSGGEQQRIAIAIALANNPRLLLCDEPTGAVDSKTTAEILNLFRELNRKLGITIVIVTHDRLVSSFADRAVMIRDGRTSSEFIRRNTAEALSKLSGFDSEEEEGGTEEKEREVEELTVVDKNGRIQLPHEYLEELGVSGRSMAKVSLEDGKIVIRME